VRCIFEVIGANVAKTVRAFEVQLNGKKLCVAGMRKGIVAISLKWIARPRRTDEVGGIYVGGLIHGTNQHVRWSTQRLDVGDELRIKLVEKSTVDKPLKVKRQAQS
jgi:hypothetical protein